MAAKGPGPLKLASRALLTRRQPPALTPRRTFLDSVLQPNKPLTINVSRTLPYTREKLYDLIVSILHRGSLRTTECEMFIWHESDSTLERSNAVCSAGHRIVKRLLGTFSV